MTVPASSRKSGPYNGNGVATAFAFDFKVFAKEDLRVVYTDASGVENDLTLDADYNVSLNPDQDTDPGGSVTTLAVNPIANSTTLTIVGDLALDQETDLTNGGGFFPQVIEDALDRAAIMSQQVKQLADRSVKFAVADTDAPIDLPPAAQRAGFLLGFDAVGALVLLVQGAASSASSFVSSAGASLIGWIQSGIGAVLRTVQDKLRERVSVKDFGAVGDFDPATGTGTDDRVAIQKAFTHAQSLGKRTRVEFPNGNYYLGTGYSDVHSGGGITAQLVIGSRTVANACNDMIVSGPGAVYQGAPGVAFGIFNANRVTVEDLKMVGYAGGALSSIRQADGLILIALNSKQIKIDGNYITNSLGYTIWQTGDPDASGGGTGSYCQDITITNNTIKCRYGDGVKSYNSGSASAWAMAFIDVISLRVRDNVIIGVIDIESNLAGQYAKYIDISGNTFASGWVTPVVPSGATNYWADEVVIGEPAGGTAIAQGINTGPGGNGTAGDQNHNVIEDNSFENGSISVLNADLLAQTDVLINRFNKGKIILGANNAVLARGITCSGNKAERTTDGLNGFIEINGIPAALELDGNMLFDEDLPVVYSPNGDSGGNVVSNNRSMHFNGGTSNPAVVWTNKHADTVLENNWAPIGVRLPTWYHTGGLPPSSSTAGTDTTPVVTETYFAAVFIETESPITGIGLLNGSAVAGNIKLALLKTSGEVVAQTASTAQSGTAGIQKVPLTAVYQPPQRGLYFIALQCSSTSARFRSHAIGVFGANKKTGETYGTFTTITPPTTFTADLGPIASTY